MRLAVVSACPHGCADQLLDVKWTVGGETRRHVEFIVPSTLATSRAPHTQSLDSADYKSPAIESMRQRLRWNNRLPLPPSP